MNHSIAKVPTRYFCLLLTFVYSTLVYAQPVRPIYADSGNNTSSESFEILVSQQYSKCRGDSAGAINLFMLGGFEPFQFQWNDGSTDQNRTNLTAGVYSVTITDGNNTVQSTSVTIEDGVSPFLTLSAVAATCTNNSANADAQLRALTFAPDNRFDYSTGSSYSGSATEPNGLPTIPAGGQIASALPNPAMAQPYTVRVFNERGCYIDVTTTLSPVSCSCAPVACVPIMIKRSK